MATLPEKRLAPGQLDPSRTGGLRRAFCAELRRRFIRFRAEVIKLLVVEDAFGLGPSKPLTWNTRFKFRTSAEKVAEFEKWVKDQVRRKIIQRDPTNPDDWLMAFIRKGFESGAGKSFDAARVPKWGEKLDFTKGTREGFLKAAFSNPVSKEKLDLLVSRTFTDLKGVTDAMATRLTRELAEGLVKGLSPREIARNINGAVRKIDENRALMIARTEIIRAHAEGQLDALESMGFNNVRVKVEWSANKKTACPKCRKNSGKVFTIKQARGLIPAHPNCKCAFIPSIK